MLKWTQRRRSTTTRFSYQHCLVRLHLTLHQWDFWGKRWLLKQQPLRRYPPWRGKCFCPFRSFWCESFPSWRICYWTHRGTKSLSGIKWSWEARKSPKPQCKLTLGVLVWWKTSQVRKRRESLRPKNHWKESWPWCSSFGSTYQSYRTACKWWRWSLSSFLRALRFQKSGLLDHVLVFSELQFLNSSPFCPACDPVLLSCWLLALPIPMTLYGSSWFYFQLPNRRFLF